MWLRDALPCGGSALEGSVSPRCTTTSVLRRGHGSPTADIVRHVKGAKGSLEGDRFLNFAESEEIALKLCSDDTLTALEPHCS